MTMPEIKVDGLTKDYGHGRGVYDVSFEIKKGEAFGFLGPNGAGKSTTMRHLMGFSNSKEGNVYIKEMPCWKDHSKIMASVGYLPGEVSLPEGLSGVGFLEMMRNLRKSNVDRTEELIETFKVNINESVKKMSIGEKRKLAVVAAFMSDPEILLLDEPTSGLDPVMQEVFIEFIRREKERGKTVLLSSHIFSEVEALCDRIAIIKDGRIVSIVDAKDVKKYKRKSFKISFENLEDLEKFKNEKFEVRGLDEVECWISVICENDKCDKLIKTLMNYRVLMFIEDSQTLEDYFMHFYKSNHSFGGLSKRKNAVKGRREGRNNGSKDD